MDSSLRPKARKAEPLFNNMNYHQYMEYIADEVKNNPIAQLGVDPNVMSMIMKPQGPLSKDYEEFLEGRGSPIKNAFYNYVDENEDYVDIGENLKEGKAVQAHEFTHRGFRLLKNYYDEDPEYFVKKYGQGAANIVKDIDTPEGHRRHEFDTEMYDNREAVFETPSGSMKYSEHFEGNNETVDKFQRYRSLLGPRVEKTRFNKLDKFLFDAFQQLERAAGDMINKRKGYAPGGSVKSSLRPRSRPIKDQTEEMLRPKSRLDAQKEKEKRQLQMKTFGDLEYRADLDKQLSWNPIARLGYNPDAHKVFKQTEPKTGLAFQGGGPRTIKKLKELGYEGAEKAQQGSVITTTNYSFSPVISHEFTHIGFDILKKRRNKDPEAFDKKYGEDAGKILKLTESGKLKEEYYIEFFDDLNTRFNTDMLPEDFKEFPKSTIRDTVQSYPSGPAVSIADRGEEKRNKRIAEIEKFQNIDLKRKEKGKESLYLDKIDKGILGLMDAAQDILTEQGEPPKAKMKTLSFWEKVGKSFSNLKPVGTRGLYEGGLSAQTEEAFNTDAEGRRRRRPSQAYLERSKEGTGQVVENVLGALPGIGTAMTVEEIQEELQKDDPNYSKIALLGGSELIGLIPGLGTAAKAGLRKVASSIGADRLIKALDAPKPKPESEIIAGPGATGYYDSSYDRAKELKERGYSPAQIEQMTGRFQTSTFDDYLNKQGRALADISPDYRNLVGIRDHIENLIKQISTENSSSAASEIAKYQKQLVDLNQKIAKFEKANPVDEAGIIVKTPNPFKFEIDDSRVEIRGSDGFQTLKESTKHYPIAVGNIIPTHTELFKEYPSLRNVVFYIDPKETGSGARFDDTVGTHGAIVFGPNNKSLTSPNSKKFRNIFFHELQHAAQFQDYKIAGLKQLGGNPVFLGQVGTKEYPSYKAEKDILGKNKNFVKLRDEILDIFEKQRGTGALDKTSKGATLPGQVPNPGEVFGDVDVAKKMARKMRQLESELFKTYMRNVSEVEARVVGRRAAEIATVGSVPKPRVTSNLSRERKIETLKEFQSDEPKSLMGKKVEDFKLKLGPMTDEEILRYATGGINFARYAKGIDKDLQGFNLFGPTKPNYAEGGAVDMSLDRQMSFAFEEGGLRDDGMNQDPVSGNEVPSGSMAKEVRDDIPAQLSEGEYVVPADVVRYYGVKFFEDLRTEAKMGLQNMEANGRIGGEPVPVGGPKAGENPLTPEEMEMLKQLGMSAGGSVRGFSQGGSVPDWVTPPPEGAIVTQVLTTLVNPITGETFTAPTGGYSINYNALQQAESPPKMADFDYFKSAPFQNSYERRPPGSTYFRTQAEIDADKGITTGPKDDEEGGFKNSEEYCASLGMNYDPETKMCVPIEKPRQTSSSDDDDDRDPVETKPWYEGITADAEDSVSRYFGTGAQIGAGIAGFVGAASPLGLIGGAGLKYGVQGTNIAQARAEIALRTAAGDTEGASLLQSALDKQLKGSTGLAAADKFFENTFNSSGEKNVISALEAAGIDVPDSIKNKNFRGDPDFDGELMSYMSKYSKIINEKILKRGAPKVAPVTNQVPSNNGNQGTLSSVASTHKERYGLGGSRRKDDSPSAAERHKKAVEATKKIEASTPKVKTKTGSGSMADVSEKAGGAAKSYSDIAKKDDPYGLLNKGGLMKKKKK